MKSGINKLAKIIAVVCAAAVLFTLPVIDAGVMAKTADENNVVAEATGEIAAEVKNDLSGFTKVNKKYRGAVVKRTAKIFSMNSTSSTVVKKVRFGDKMRIKAQSKKWYFVRCKGKKGYILRKNVVKYNVKKKHIALTFDDGPSQATTGKVLKALKKNKCKATFFVLGCNINSRTAKLIRREARMGCEIGNHSYNHPLLTGKTSKQIRKQLRITDKKVKKLTGKKPAICRAPYGGYNKKVIRVMKRPNIFWSMDTLDWKYRSTKRLVRVVPKYARNGQIVLMHDIHPSTAKAVDKICKKLKKKNFEMVTVTELAAIKGYNFTAGHTYSRFKTKKH